MLLTTNDAPLIVKGITIFDIVLIVSFFVPLLTASFCTLMRYQRHWIFTARQPSTIRYLLIITTIQLLVQFPIIIIGSHPFDFYNGSIMYLNFIGWCVVFNTVLIVVSIHLVLIVANYKRAGMCTICVIRTRAFLFSIRV